MKKKNMVLIGMPGSGKSVIGKIIAEKLMLSFIDIDAYIEKSTKQTITEIFRNGETFFRDIETKAVEEVSIKDFAVISTGGGVISRPENIINLKKNGIIIYINRTVENIARDVDVQSRPILAKDPSEIYRLFERRGPLYKKYCDHEIMNISNIDDAVDSIIDIYKEINK